MLLARLEKKSIKTADKYGMYQFDPVLNIPLNKDGTVTVYYHTTKEEALKINSSKVIPSDGKARIYLTNESNGAPIVRNRGNFDQTLDGSTVILNVPPSILQVDQNYDNGRIDFFVPMAQGEYFNRKMRMASIQKGRKEAIVETFSYKEHEDRITAALAEYNSLDTKAKRARLKQAGDILKKEHNVGTLLTENGKLEKTRLGDFEIEGYEGNSITSMGLGLAAAQQISDKVSTCNRSAICEGLCLGETSGGNFLYGGAASEDVGDIQKSAFRAAARMFQYLKTEALIVHPEEFAIKLQSEIDLLKRWATKNGYDPAVRLNVTSDFKPDMFSGLINANSGVMFYDYTKLNGNPIAPNHHLTYSSTGFGQIVNGEPVFFKNKAGQYDHNWGAVRKRLDDGYGVAMAFSSKSALPKALFDEETGKTYQVWDGDMYDARFLDPKADDGVTGQIVGLRNKASTLKEKTAAAETGGFFIDYDPKRDGDTVTVPDQSQFKGKVIPIAKKSLRPFNKEELPQDERTYILPADTLLYHGAYKERAEQIERGGNALLSRPPMRVSGGATNEGGLIFFGGEATARKYADNIADPMAVKFAREAGVERLPGKVFETATDRPYKLINRYHMLSAAEAKTLNEALGLPEYKGLMKGDPLEIAATRAHDYDDSKIERYEVTKRTGKGTDKISAPWPVIFRALNVDGFFDGFAVALTADNGIRLTGKEGKMERFSLRAPK